MTETVEWWDVLDAAGHRTGKRVRRGVDMLTEGTYHLVVGVCPIRPDGTVLVSQRASTKDWALEWEFPAGSAVAGEDSRAAAVRELGEEVGIVVAEDELEEVGRLTEAEALFDFYLARVAGDVTLTLQGSEVADARWLPIEDAERMWRVGMFADPWGPRLEAWMPAIRRAVLERA